MQSLLLNFYLYRSNPIIMRQIAVPTEFSPDELSEICCIVFDIERPCCSCELNIDDCPVDNKYPEVSSVFPGMTGTVHLASSSSGSSIFSLEIRFSVEACADQDISRPILKSWTGYHIPKGCFNTAYINSMQSVFNLKDSWQSPSGEIQYKDLLLCKPGKVNNALCRRYAPDQVKPEVRTDIRIPIHDLLETVNLNVLKRAAEDNDMWSYSGAKKSFFVDAMASRLESSGVERVFGEMDMDEYLRFYKLVTNGESTYQYEDDIEQYFPALFRNFRICYLKKQGIRIASDILINYEKWFDKPDELIFRQNKRIRQVMRWCLFTYAIFSISDCYKVAEAVYPGEISLEVMQRYWLNTPFYTSPEFSAFTHDSREHKTLESYAYDTRVIDPLEAIDFAAVEREDSSMKKIPENTEAFETMATRALNYSRYELTPQEISAMYTPWYSDHYDAFEKANYGVDLVRRGMSPEDAAKKVLKKYDRWSYNSDERLQAYTDYLSRIENDIPLFLYYGFNRYEVRKRKIESVMLKKYSELQKEKASRELAKAKAMRDEMAAAYSSKKRR